MIIENHNLAIYAASAASSISQDLMNNQYHTIIYMDDFNSTNFYSISQSKEQIKYYKIYGKTSICLHSRMPGNKNSSELCQSYKFLRNINSLNLVQSLKFVPLHTNKQTCNKYQKKNYSNSSRSRRQGSKGSISINNCSTYILVLHTDCIQIIKQKIQSQTKENTKQNIRW